MIDKSEYGDLHAWLRQLRWSLAALPERDRCEIVAEFESHLHERLEAGALAPQVLAALGSATECARPYVEQYGVASALGSGKALDLLPVIGRRAGHDFASFSTLVFGGLLWILPVVMIATSIMKLVSPGIAGLWRVNGNYMLGIIDDPAKGTELLGLWLFPLTLAIVVLAVFLSRWLVLRMSWRLAANDSTHRRPNP